MLDYPKLFRPALLLDVLKPALPLMRLCFAPQASADQNLLVHLRVAELYRRFLPDEALVVLESLPAGSTPVHPILKPHVIRCHALLEKQEIELAVVAIQSAQLPQCSGALLP